MKLLILRKLKGEKESDFLFSITEVALRFVTT